MTSSCAPRCLLNRDIYYQSAYLDSEQADLLLRQLYLGSTWQQWSIRLFGRLVEQPRLSAWYGEPEAVYRYSGITLKPLVWLPPLKALAERLQRDLGTAFNSVLLNCYRNGADSMGWHADNEPELGACPTIASVSLGAARALSFRRHGHTRQAFKQVLQHGSLLVMRGASQTQWQHCLNKTSRDIGLRVNLTFRQIVSD